MRIRRNANAAPEGKHRRDIINLPPLPRHKMSLPPPERHKEHALDVRVHDVIPVFPVKSIASSRRIKPALFTRNYQYDRIPSPPNAIDLTQIGCQACKTTSQSGDARNSFRGSNNVNTDNAQPARQPCTPSPAPTGIAPRHNRDFTFARKKCIQNHC